MTFVYTYRSATGAIAEGSLEAIDRAACYAQLKVKGITPISVKQGELKRQLKRRNNSSALKYVVAGALIICIGLGVWWCFSGGRAPIKSSAKPVKVVKVEKPVPVKKSLVTNAVPVAVVEQKEKPKIDPDKVTKAIPAGRRDKVVDKDGNVTYVRHKPPFTNRVDTLVMSAIRPGGFPIGLRQWVKTHSREQLIAALKAPVNFDADDSEQMTFTKKCVVDTKAQMLQCLKEGHEIDEILGEIETVVDAERNQRNIAEKTLRLLMEQGNAETVREYAKAANAELKAKGMKGLYVPKKFQETPEEQAANAASAETVGEYGTDGGNEPKTNESNGEEPKTEETGK